MNHKKILSASLDQLADRIVRKGEVKEFILLLLDKGANKKDIETAIDVMLLQENMHTVRSTNLFRRQYCFDRI